MKKQKIGKGVVLGKGVTLGNDIIIFPNSEFLTPSIIEDNAIIGGGVTILPNVTIGENSVVAAGSTVTKNVLPNTVVKGIPAKTMMSREEYEVKRLEFVESMKHIRQ